VVITRRRASAQNAWVTLGEYRWVSSGERRSSLPLSDSLTAVVACAERWCAPSPFADDVSMLAVEICSPGG